MTAEEQGELRIHRHDPFTIVPNDTIRDKELSFRARGILAWLLSHADGFKVTSAAIAAAGKEGRDSVRSALGELEARGYYQRERFQGEKGRWRTVIHVSARPRPDFQASVDPASARQALREEEQVEEQRTAVAVAPALSVVEPPCNEDAAVSRAVAVTAREIARANADEADEIARAYWEWVKRETKHDPPEAFLGIRKIVAAALKADFDRHQIKVGLARLRDGQRPITKQTLWQAMSGAPKAAPRPVARGANDDWIEAVAAINAEQAGPA